MRILLVEDDELLGDGLKAGLKQHKYTVDWVKDGLSAEQVLKYDAFDIIVLDLGLPKLSGLDLMERLRKQGNEIPILILTARESIDDKIRGLDKGADDYMVKPCDLDELAARIRALHRRKTGSSSPTLQFGKLLLEPSSHDVSYDGAPVPLARREYMLLEKLVESVGKIVTRESLVQTLYGWSDVDSNTLEVHIHSIRKKLPKNFIRTIRGVGYMLTQPKEADVKPQANEKEDTTDKSDTDSGNETD